MDTPNRLNGTVKWFDAKKGFGFIKPDDQNDDVFVHISAVEKSGLGRLQENQRISFELVQDSRSNKKSAGNLQVING